MLDKDRKERNEKLDELLRKVEWELIEAWESGDDSIRIAAATTLQALSMREYLKFGAGLV